MNRIFRFLGPLILGAGMVGAGQDNINADVPKVAPSTPQRVRISSGVAVGQLKKKVNPHYPEEAKQAGIEGQVVLRAEIGKDGTIQNLQLISGHPVLAAAAIDAVKKWKYKPYLFQGNPVAVETQVVVNFQLR